MAVEVDIKQLLEAGVHFGHKTSRWHPKMAPYIHSKRQDSHIIDLTKTVEQLDKALPFITKVAATKPVLFVGTKKQAKEIVKVHISSASHPFFTGEEKIIDTEGRVDRFKARAKAAEERRKALSNKAVKKTTRAEKKDAKAESASKAAKKPASPEKKNTKEAGSDTKKTENKE